jgi:hypothetical protein
MKLHHHGKMLHGLEVDTQTQFSRLSIDSIKTSPTCGAVAESLGLFWLAGLQTTFKHRVITTK